MGRWALKGEINETLNSELNDLSSQNTRNRDCFLFIRNSRNEFKGFREDFKILTFVGVSKKRPAHGLLLLS
jgi:hypothetical protein